VAARALDVCDGPLRAHVDRAGLGLVPIDSVGREDRKLRLRRDLILTPRRPHGLPVLIGGAWPRRSRIEVKVGILILVSLGILAVFILVMGGILIPKKTYTVYVDFDNPGGLNPARRCASRA